VTEKYDAIVIGTGQSGPALAVRLANAGRKTAIIERKLFGGTCVNVGCIPTKTLIASARAAHVARHGADFGVAIDGKITVDMMRVKARKDSVVRQSNEGVTKWLGKTPNLTVLEVTPDLKAPVLSASTRDCWRRERSSSTSAGGRPCPTCPASPKTATSPIPA